MVGRGTPQKSNIDTKHDGLESVSPFKHGYLGYPRVFGGVFPIKIVPFLGDIP